MNELLTRLRYAWRALIGGDIGPIGWCGQIGYWWTRPCPHHGQAHGCGWYGGEGKVHFPDPSRCVYCRKAGDTGGEE